MRSKTLLTKLFAVFEIAGLVCLGGCGGGTSQTLNNQPLNPPPAITTISPSTAAAGGMAFTLTINGANFVAASMVSFGGTAPTTTFVSTTQLTAAIPAAAIATVGTAGVIVTNPAPGGGTSNAVNFTVTSGPNPVPTINFLDPSCAPAGSKAFTLAVFGENLVASSVVRWNGRDLPTTFNNGITAQVPATDSAVIGRAAVTVFNPAPGGGSSNSLTFTTTTGGVAPQSIAVDPTGKFAYVANLGCPDAFTGNVSIYTIDPTTGALMSVGSPVDSGDFGADSVTVDPSGRFAYVANSGASDTAGSVSMYTVNSTSGALTPIGTIVAPCAPPPSPGSCAPYSVAVHPSGKFAYVANEGGFTPTSISMYTIDATTGALTSTGTIAAEGRAVSVIVDPSGKFAYVADGGDNSDGSPGVNVSAYAINAISGALTSIGTIPAGMSPSSIAIDPSGKFTYVANSGSNNVSVYSIDATTGILTSIGPIAAGTNPSSVAVDPLGKFAYVVNSGSNDVSMYTINATTGTLTSIGTIPAGTSPNSMAIDPSGKFAYVANSGSNDVSIYSIDAATGALTLIGTIGT